MRKLENLVRRLAALCANDTIGADDVAQHLTPNRSATRRQNETLSQSIEGQLQTYFENHGEMLPAPGLYDRMLRELERPLLALTLDATEGNQLKAAEILGINRNTLRKKLRDLDIEAIRGRGAGR